LAYTPRAACIEACPNDALHITDFIPHSLRAFARTPEEFTALVAKRRCNWRAKPKEVV